MYPNENERLWPGEFVAAHLQIEMLHNAVTVPLPAVQHGPEGTFVFIVKPDQTVAQQAVTVSYQNSDLAVLSQGLKGGENIVLTGQSRLEPGSRVAITQPDAGSPGTQASNAPAASPAH